MGNSPASLQLGFLAPWGFSLGSSLLWDSSLGSSPLWGRGAERARRRGVGSNCRQKRAHNYLAPPQWQNCTSAKISCGRALGTAGVLQCESLEGSRFPQRTQPAARRRKPKSNPDRADIPKPNRDDPRESSTFVVRHDVRHRAVRIWHLFGGRFREPCGYRRLRRYRFPILNTKATAITPGPRASAFRRRPPPAPSARRSHRPACRH